MSTFSIATTVLLVLGAFLIAVHKEAKDQGVSIGILAGGIMFVGGSFMIILDRIVFLLTKIAG